MNFDKLTICEDKKTKTCKSSDYNFIFNKTNGFFARWGKTVNDDPNYAPSPEILDLEISSGPCEGKCKFCYKSNGDNTLEENMSFDEFKNIINKFDKNLTQVAFGITDCHGNKDMFKMMKYLRSKGIIPNYTTHGLDVTDVVAELTSRLCGAVAVSIVNKNKSYDAIKKFNDYGMEQVNIHLVIYEERMKYVYSVLDDIKNDPRLSKLNAVVFLGLKNKGKAATELTSCSKETYKKLVQYCFDNDIPFGFDSCSAPKFEEAVLEMNISKEKREMLLSMSESCESGLFSSYINVKGKFYVCSFAEGEKTQDEDWTKGIDVNSCNSFTTDIWNSDKVISWRNNLLNSCDKKGCRKCLMYPAINP